MILPAPSAPLQNAVHSSAHDPVLRESQLSAAAVAGAAAAEQGKSLPDALRGLRGW